MRFIFIVIKSDKETDVLDYFKNEKCLITFEKPDTNPHFHIILQSDIANNTIRNSISRKFNLSGGQRTVKNCNDLESSVVYILKDGNVKKNTLFTKEQLQEYVDCTNQINKVNKDIKKCRKDSFKRLIVTTYTKLEITTSTYAYDIYDHIQDHIHKKFGSSFESLDEMIYKRCFYKILNFHYPKLGLQVMRVWHSRLDLPDTIVL